MGHAGGGYNSTKIYPNLGCILIHTSCAGQMRQAGPGAIPLGGAVAAEIWPSQAGMKDTGCPIFITNIYVSKQPLVIPSMWRFWEMNYINIHVI